MYILTAREERKMVTKEDVEKAEAKAEAVEAAAVKAALEASAALAAATDAWEEYVKLKEEFKNAN